MTVIRVTSPTGRIGLAARQKLAPLLTDAVMVPEIGQFVAAARAGFQVHFRELAAESMAFNGQLLSQAEADVMLIDIAVMDGDWPTSVRKQVIELVYLALVSVFDIAAPSPTWWINFRVIEEGSWGSRGGVLSILDLLELGVFTEEKKLAIRSAIAMRKQS
jgi:hypothetical protein